MLCGIKLGLIIIIMIINDYDDDINNNITGMVVRVCLDVENLVPPTFKFIISPPPKTEQLCIFKEQCFPVTRNVVERQMIFYEVGAIFTNFPHYSIMMDCEIYDGLDHLLISCAGNRNIMEPGNKGWIKELQPFISDMKN